MVPSGWEGIYCHSDGDPNGVGLTLFRHYKDPAKVAALIALGDISQLGERIVPRGPHSFEKPERGTTVAYMRDRGEAGLEPITGPTVDSVAENIEHDGYVYAFDGCQWWLGDKLLADELKKTTII